MVTAVADILASSTAVSAARGNIGAHDGPFNADLTHAILAAPDHYAAIGAHRGMELPELRRCYLKTSMLVHPDKNQHEDATKAFQRSSLAWTVLSDDKERHAYDEKLARQCGGTGSGDWAIFGAGQPGAGDTSDDLSRAFMAFACAARTAGCGEPAAQGGQFFDELFFAQMLAQNQAASWAAGQPGLPQSEDEDPSALQSTAMPMALSVLTYGVGTGMRACGLGKAGKTVQNLALFQLVGQCGMALQSSEVRAKISDGAVAVYEQAQQLADEGQRVRQQWRHFWEPPQAPRMSTTASREASDAGASWPRVGAWVRIVGLVQAAHLNGRVGEVLGQDSQTGRIIVSVFEPITPVRRRRGSPAAGVPAGHFAGDGGEREGEAAAATPGLPEAGKKKVRVENLEPAIRTSVLAPEDASTFL